MARAVEALGEQHDLALAATTCLALARCSNVSAVMHRALAAYVALQDSLGRVHPRTVRVQLCEQAVHAFRQRCPSLPHSLEMACCLPPKQLICPVTAPARAAVQQQQWQLHGAAADARSLAHALASRRNFDAALQITRGELARIRNLLCRHVFPQGKNWRAHVGAEEMWSAAEQAREHVHLQCMLGAMLQGAGRYTEAAAAYDAAFRPFGDGAASVPAVPSHDDHVAVVLAWGLQLQRQTRPTFAQHCLALLILLRAFASSPALRPSHCLPPHLQPPPTRALHLLWQLWRSSSRGADERIPIKQRSRALSVASSAAAAATRLASADRWPHVHRPQALAALIMRRCFSCRGAHALLTACAQPPHYACA
jgi:hypothetical protein